MTFWRNLFGRSLFVVGSIFLVIVAFGSLPPAPDKGWLAEEYSVLHKLVFISLLFLPFQLLFPLVKRRARFFTAEFWTDVLYAHLGLLWTWLAVVEVPLWGARTLWGEHVWFPVLGEGVPRPIQLLLTIWIFDFAVYWRHRFEHTFRPLWWFHSTHHTATSVDPLTTNRIHVGEYVLGMFFNATIAQIGFEPAVVGTAFSIYLLWNYFIHANVDLRFPGFMKYVLVSPFMHQWHHATDVEARGKNVGVVFAWNDWLFGTAYHPAHAPTSFGLGDVPAGDEMWRTPLGHVLYPATMAFRTAFRLVRPRRAAME